MKATTLIARSQSSNGDIVCAEWANELATELEALSEDVFDSSVVEAEDGRTRAETFNGLQVFVGEDENGEWQVELTAWAKS